MKWEQAIIDRSNEDLIQQGGEKGRYLELFQFVLEEAWKREGEITPDEKNLIEKIRKRFKITEVEYRIIEANLGTFQKPRISFIPMRKLKKSGVSYRAVG